MGRLAAQKKKSQIGGIQFGVKMKISIIKHDGILYPAGEHSISELASVKNGVEYVIDIKMNRNPKFHRKAFELLNVIFDNQDGFTSFDLFRAWITMKAGYVITGKTPNGTIIFLPKSLAYEKMTQDVFEKWYQQVISVAVANYGHDKNALDRIMSFS